jgi:hypothetical protein
MKDDVLRYLIKTYSNKPFTRTGNEFIVGNVKINKIEYGLGIVKVTKKIENKSRSFLTLFSYPKTKNFLNNPELIKKSLKNKEFYLFDPNTTVQVGNIYLNLSTSHIEE